MFNMKHVDSESPSDVARWLQSESADLWPAVLGSLSLRRSRCIRGKLPGLSVWRAASKLCPLRSRPRRSRQSMIWWCRRRSPSNWRTAKSCVSTPQWSRPTFIIRLTTRCCGMSFVSSRACSAAALGRRRIKGCRDRTRSARRRMQDIQRMTTRQRQEQQTEKYRELIGIAEEVLENARMALRNTRKAHGKDMLADIVIAETRKDIEHFCDLGARVINQSRRRVLHGEQVPTAEKIYSIFEPHTDLIKRGKVQTPIEFGHKVFLAESAHGLITQYEVLDGNPVDEQHVVVSLERHKQTFGYVPELYGSDRGFFSEQNVTSCKQEGVKVVCIPQRGGTKAPEREAYEKSREFKDGQRFRAGIEGRISVLFRGRGMKRCLAQGRERFELWVAAAVLANNLMKIAALLTDRSLRRRKAA